MKSKQIPVLTSQQALQSADIRPARWQAPLPLMAQTYICSLHGALNKKLL
jgi:hypothetical protein